MLALPSVAGAEEAGVAEPGVEDAGATDAGAAEPTRPKSKWAPAAAVFPGLLVHGSGHWVGGDPKTGKRLAALEGAGLLVALLGAVPLALTGAQRHVVGPSIALTLAGSGAFLTGWLADIYGSSGGAALGGEPAPLFRLGASLGLGHVYDPQFDHRAFGVLESHFVWRWGLRLDGGRWESLDGDAQQTVARTRFRLLGRRSPGRRTDGSFLDVWASTSGLERSDEGFSIVGFGLGLSGRYDLFHLGRNLRGAFVELELGIGWNDFAFASGASDGSAQLLGGFGFGLYLGRGRGELALYYDHERDDFAGGLAFAGPGNGFVGSFGARGRYWLTRQWGLRGELEVGSAYVSSLALAFRWGPR